MTTIATPIMLPGTSAPGFGTVVDCFEVYEEHTPGCFQCLIVLTSARQGKHYVIASWDKRDSEPGSVIRSYSDMAVAWKDFSDLKLSTVSRGIFVPRYPDDGDRHPDGKHHFEGGNWVES